ncbi:MAG: ABC-2 family transporter protein [Planctomycetaceae bacterium]
MNSATPEFRPDYWTVWKTFFRNSLIREMTFRGDLIITILTRTFWFAAQVVLFDVIYQHVASIKDWNREEYLAFMATGMLINSFVEAFFMPNISNFSELIRTGDLDFALLKPIDTQFLISFQKVNLAMLQQVLLAGALLGYSLYRLDAEITVLRVAMYLMLIGVGVAFFYALMITLASTSVWTGRNQSLYDFWFYLTIFARYPQNIYRGIAGDILWFGFSFCLPILLVVTVPARVLLTKVLDPDPWALAIPPALTLLLLYLSRRLFQWSLDNYRSASS